MQREREREREVHEQCMVWNVFRGTPNWGRTLDWGIPFLKHESLIVFWWESCLLCLGTKPLFIEQDAAKNIKSFF